MAGSGTREVAIVSEVDMAGSAAEADGDVALFATEVLSDDGDVVEVVAGMSVLEDGFIGWITPSWSGIPKTPGTPDSAMFLWNKLMVFGISTLQVLNPWSW